MDKKDETEDSKDIIEIPKEVIDKINSMSGQELESLFIEAMIETEKKIKDKEKGKKKKISKIKDE